jgi:NAD-dependent dihydropyrimidine dehydrogenase PreA subunit
MAEKKEPVKPPNIDVFQLLKETASREKRKQREQLLASSGMKELFTEGKITINERTCRGVECKLCIKVCPTNALYWKRGKVGIIEELCVYCGACVLSCIVDDCITIVRRRATGEIERFSKAKDFLTLQTEINAIRRQQRIEEVKKALPSPESFKKSKKKRKN